MTTPKLTPRECIYMAAMSTSLSSPSVVVKSVMDALRLGGYVIKPADEHVQHEPQTARPA